MTSTGSLKSTLASIRASLMAAIVAAIVAAVVAAVVKWRLFCRRFLSSAQLAVISQLEYRFNFFTDAVIQPTIVGLIEVTIWSAILSSTGQSTLNGFTRGSYLAYALWAAFFARIGANWMYEFRMVEEIESGSVNSILSRPISFFEFYLGQFLGYKVLTSLTSFIVPITITLSLPGLAISDSTILSRLPLAFALQLLYLVLVHIVSFSVASIAFFLNRTYGFTVAKNIILSMLTGELFPLDLVPAPFKQIFLWSPFANSVYVPVGYLTGRLGIDAVERGLLSLGIGIIISGFIASLLWSAGCRRYSGTGA